MSGTGSSLLVRRTQNVPARKTLTMNNEIHAFAVTAGLVRRIATRRRGWMLLCRRTVFLPEASIRYVYPCSCSLLG